MSEKAVQLLRLLKTSKELNIPKVCKQLGIDERNFRQVLRELENAGKVKVSLRVEVL